MDTTSNETYYRKCLTDCTQYDREQSIDFLLTHTPKNQVQYALYTNKDFTDSLTDKDLILYCKKLIRSKLSLIRKLKQKRKSRIDKKDHYGTCREYKTGYFFIDRNKPYASKWTYITIDMQNKHTQRNLQYSFNSIKRLIKSLFSNHRKVMVVRCDLYGKRDENDNDLDLLNNSFSKLQRETLYGLDYYLGYYCSREYTIDRQIHLHCYFFLNGNKVKREIDFLERIGTKWKKMTGGYVYCRNLDRNRLPDRSEVLGTVCYWDLRKIDKLIFVSKYLLKNLGNREWLEKVKNGKENNRLFTCSFRKEGLENNRKIPRKWDIDYSWIDSVKLSDTKSVFDGKLKLENYKTESSNTDVDYRDEIDCPEEILFIP